MSKSDKSKTPVSTVIAGTAMALFFLVGRWGPTRVVSELTASIGSGNYFSLMLQPRQWLWIVMTVALVARLLQDSPRKQGNAGVRFPWYERINFVFIMLLLAYMMAGVFWAPNLNLALSKAYEVLIMLVTLAVIRLWIVSGWAEELRRLFWTATTAITAVIALCSIPMLGSVERLATLGGGPNVFARLMGLLAIGSLNWKKYRLPGQVFVVPAVALGLVVLSGSRGGMLATAIGLLTYLVFDRRSVVAKVLLIGMCVAIGATLLLTTGIGGEVLSSFASRVVHLTIEKQYDSGRMILFQDSIDMWRTSPIFGVGLSGFSTFSNKLYPHNLFLEILSEGGLIGVGLFVLCLLPPIAMIVFHRRQVHSASVAAFVMYLAASMFSGDLYNSLGVFLLSMLVVVPDFATAERQFLKIERSND